MQIIKKKTIKQIYIIIITALLKLYINFPISNIHSIYYFSIIRTKIKIFSYVQNSS